MHAACTAGTGGAAFGGTSPPPAAAVPGQACKRAHTRRDVPANPRFPAEALQQRRATMVAGRHEGGQARAGVARARVRVRHGAATQACQTSRGYNEAIASIGLSRSACIRALASVTVAAEGGRAVAAKAWIHLADHPLIYSTRIECASYRHSQSCTLAPLAPHTSQQQHSALAGILSPHPALLLVCAHQSSSSMQKEGTLTGQIKHTLCLQLEFWRNHCPHAHAYACAHMQPANTHIHPRHAAAAGAAGAAAAAAACSAALQSLPRGRRATSSTSSATSPAHARAMEQPHTHLRQVQRVREHPQRCVHLIWARARTSRLPHTPSRSSTGVAHVPFRSPVLALMNWARIELPDTSNLRGGPGGATLRAGLHAQTRVLLGHWAAVGATCAHTS